MEKPKHDVTTRESQSPESKDLNMAFTSSKFSFIKEMVINIGIERRFLAKFIPVGVWFGSQLFKSLFSAIGMTTEQAVFKITQ